MWHKKSYQYARIRHAETEKFGVQPNRRQQHISLFASKQKIPSLQKQKIAIGGISLHATKAITSQAKRRNYIMD